MSLEERKFNFIHYLQTFRGKSVLAAALLCIFIFATIFPFFGDDKVYAYMSIDVNPSIELGVNEKFQVIEMIPYNDEGKEIIASIPKWKKKNIHELTSVIIHEMKEKGYIKNNPAVLLATVSNKENELEKNISWKKEMSAIQNIVSNENLKLKVIEGSKEEREKAKEKGLTTGSYKENQLVKETKSTSPFKENSDPKETSVNGNNNEKQTTTDNANKTESLKQSEQDFEKQENKNENKDKPVPPGQEKKKENIEMNHTSKWEHQSDKKDKQNNKKDKDKNKDKNNDKNKDRKKDDDDEDEDDDKDDDDGDRKQKNKDRYEKEHHQKQKDNNNKNDRD